MNWESLFFPGKCSLGQQLKSVVLTWADSVWCHVGQLRWGLGGGGCWGVATEKQLCYLGKALTPAHARLGPRLSSVAMHKFYLQYQTICAICQHSSRVEPHTHTHTHTHTQAHTHTGTQENVGEKQHSIISWHLFQEIELRFKQFNSVCQQENYYYYPLCKRIQWMLGSSIFWKEICANRCSSSTLLPTYHVQYTVHLWIVKCIQ